MEINSGKKESFSRRQIFPFIGFSLLIPLVGFSNSKDKLNTTNNDKFQTLLKSDGTVVQVKVSTIKKAKILKKNISTKSFFNWLDRKF